MENNVKNRIQKIMDAEQLSPGAFAKHIQVNPSAISHILNERNKPSMEILTKILTTFPTINSEWLILGFGNMRKSDYQEVFNNSEPSLFDQQPVPNYIKPEPNITKESVEPMIIEKEIIKEVFVHTPKREVQKIIVYYSDNSFEEFQKL